MKQTYTTPKIEIVNTLVGNLMALQDLSAGKAHPSPARRVGTLRTIGSLNSIGSVRSIGTVK